MSAAWIKGTLAFITSVALLADIASAAHFTRGDQTAVRFGVHEIELHGNSDVPNAFETRVTVTFQVLGRDDHSVTVRAFYDGGDVWRARLYVDRPGQWTWSSRSAADPLLDGRRGSFNAVDSTLRGKLRRHPRNARQWITDDGFTFLNLADTAYILFRSPNDPLQPVSEATFRQYVEDNAALGVTSMRAGGAGGYAGWSRSDAPITGYERSNWCWQEDRSDARYWERFDLERLQTTDRRLTWLLENHPHMYVQLIMLGKTNDAGTQWQRIPERARLQTIEYLVARWSAWPQVYYLIVNDMKFTDSPANEGRVALIDRVEGKRCATAYLLAVPATPDRPHEVSHCLLVDSARTDIARSHCEQVSNDRQKRPHC
jgi:hypothetical protein